MATEKYLEALEIVMSERYPADRYHIGGYQESAVCIQSEATGWTVYNGERGNRYAEIKCDTVLKACLEFIRKMTHRVEDISAMETKLLELLFPTKIA